MTRKPPIIKYFLLLVVFVLVASAEAFGQCGGERWPVKIGTDSDVNTVSLNPTASTIASLISIARPNKLQDNKRQPAEKKTYVVSAILKKFALMYDSDYHMVIVDSAGRTMIAEIPSPNCVPAGSRFAAGIAHARAQFDAMFNPTENFQNVSVPVQITGVGFFDYLEGQAGQAPNGIELHAVLDITFDSNFSLSASPQSLTVNQGSSGSSNITSTLSGPFNSSIALSVSGLPSGASGSFSPTSIIAPGSGSSTLTVSVGSGTPTGTYNLLVTGTGGGQTHSTTMNLTVSAAGGSSQQLMGNIGFENGSSNPAPWNVTTGVIDSSSNRASHSGAWKAWLDGYGSSHTDTLFQTVSIPSNVASATLSFWLHIDTRETTTTAANDTLQVQIRNSSGVVLTTLATYSNLNPIADYSSVSFDLASFKGQTIQVYLVGTENSSLQTSFIVDDFALNTSTSGSPGDFAISSNPSGVSMVQGSSATSTISTTTSGSFNSSIDLSASGLPAGATANFTPTSIAAPGNGSATVTFLAGTATATGTYNITITGIGGGQTHSTSISLTVNSSGGGDFTISSNPSGVSIVQGSSATSTITTTTSGSFNSSIALSVSGLPAGATADFSPPSIAAPGNGSATVTFLAGSATATGTYNVTITGTGGGQTHSTPISLTVNSSGGGGTTQQLLGNPGFENGSSNPSPWSVTAGVIDNSSFEAAHSGTWKVWLNGYGSVHTDTLLQSVTIPSTATATSLTFWLHIDTAETSTTTSYDTMKVQIRNSSGTVLTTLATYSNLNAATGFKQVSFDLNSYAGQAIQIYLVGVEDSSLKTSFVVDDFALNVTTP